MASPLLKTIGRTIVTVGLAGGVIWLGYSNWTTSNDVKATTDNIVMLKQETVKSAKDQNKQSVSTSSYQRAQKDGRLVAKNMTQIMSDPNTAKNGLNQGDKAVKTVKGYDGTSAHELLYTLPYGVTGLHAVYSIGGLTDQGDISSGFLLYNQQNQLQGIIKADYVPRTRKFTGVHKVVTKGTLDANNQAMNNLQGKAANRKAGGQ